MVSSQGLVHTEMLASFYPTALPALYCNLPICVAECASGDRAGGPQKAEGRAGLEVVVRLGPRGGRGFGLGMTGPGSPKGRTRQCPDFLS
jgi:hypothetical protein